MDFKRELKKISFEFIIRFSELFLVSVVLSLLLQLLVHVDAFEHRFFVWIQFMVFAVFQIEIDFPSHIGFICITFICYSHNEGAGGGQAGGKRPLERW